MLYVTTRMEWPNLKVLYLDKDMNEVRCKEVFIAETDPYDYFRVYLLNALGMAKLYEELIVVSRDKRVRELVQLENPQDMEDIDLWMDARDIAFSKGLSLGYQLHFNAEPGQKESPKPEDHKPVRYGQSLEANAAFDAAMMKNPGELVNDGELILFDEEMNMVPEEKVRDVIMVRSFYLEDDGTFTNLKCTVKSRWVGIGETRLTRMFDKIEDPRMKVTSKVKVYRLVDKTTGELDPLALFEAVEQPAHWMKMSPFIPRDIAGMNKFTGLVSEADIAWAKHIKSAWIIRNGLPTHEGKYNFAFVSSAGQKTLAPNMMKENVRLPKELEEQLPEDYRNGAFGKLSEIEKIYDFLSFGAYLKAYGKEDSAAKLLSRFGLVLSTSVPLSAPRMRSIGRIRVPYSDYIEGRYRRIMEGRGFNEKRIKKNLKALKKFWKEDAADGSSAARASYVAIELNRIGVLNEGELWTAETVLAIDLQARIGISKGMFIVLPDEIFDLVSYDINGVTKYPYRDYDIIIEKNSLKMEWNSEVYTGDLAPKFELVNITKVDGNDKVDTQLVQCMEFRDIEAPERLRKRLIQNFDKIAEELSSHEKARIASGVVGSGYYHGDPFKEGRSWLDGYLQASGDSGPVTEPYAVKKVFSKHISTGKVNKFSVDGGRWYMLPDYSVFWKGRVEETGGIDFLSGEPIIDIFVDGPEHATLVEPDSVWANGRTGRVISYRNPLNKDGEVVDSVGLSLEEIGDQWMQRKLSIARPVIVFSVFSASANLMGGGDFDGDMAMVVWDPVILSLIFPGDFVLIDVGSGVHRIVLNYENMKNSFSHSLANAGVGLITNWGSMWTELRHMVSWNLLVQPKTVIMPIIHMYNFRDGSLEKDNLYTALFAPRAKGVGGKQPGVVTWAEEAKGLYFDLQDFEVEAIDAMIRLRQVDHYFMKKELSFAEFKEVADLLLDACRKAEDVVRYLQELSINTSKSDKWALYDREIKEDGSQGDLIPTDKYRHVALSIRPRWKRAFGSPALQYEDEDDRRAMHKTIDLDYTPMGVVSKTIRTIYLDMYSRYMTASMPIQSLFMQEGPGVYQEMAAMVQQYNRELKEIARNALYDEDTKELMFKAIVNNYRIKVEVFFERYQPIDVLKAAYTATYRLGTKDRGSNISFVYITLMNELLVYINNSTSEVIKLPVRVYPAPGYTFEHDEEGNEYEFTFVEDDKKSYIYNDGEVAGFTHCRVEGVKDLAIVGRKAYVIIDVERPVRKAKSRDFGQEIRIVRMDKHDFGEKALVNSIRYKIGCKALGRSTDLGEYQDYVKFEEGTYTDKNGVTGHELLLVVDGFVVGAVAPEFEAYVHKVLKYGDDVIVEWIRKEGKTSDSSANLKLVDVIAR